MKLQVSEDKSVDSEKTFEIDYTLGMLENSPFGINYLALSVIEDKKLSDLIIKYKDDRIKFNFFNDVLFMNFLDDDLYFYADFPDNYIDFLKQNNQIAFITKNNNIEHLILYDKIFR